jgi:hypothetical protein
MTIYYKITNKEEIHYGYKYKVGLNILEEDFNDDIIDDCNKGGFYFTTADNIDLFYNMGCNLRIIELPFDNLNFKMIQLNNKYRSNMIIFKEKYEFNNLDDFKKIYEINTNLIIVQYIYNIEILEWLKIVEHDNLQKFISLIIDNACENNIIELLEWVKHSNYKFKYNKNSLIKASENGHIEILKWFYNSNYNFQYCDYISIEAAKNGHINILEWLKSIEMDCKDFYQIFIHIAKTGKVNVLDWYKQNYNVSHCDSRFILINAACNGHVNILEWFNNENYKFTHITDAIHYAANYGQSNILDWFDNSNYEFKYNDTAINNAASNGHINILEWFKNSKHEFKYTNHAINNACKNGHVHVLEWFKNYGHKFTFNKYQLENALHNNHHNVIEWFKLNYFYHSSNNVKYNKKKLFN